jgi:UDPglucose 6-dehydrogenase
VRVAIIGTGYVGLVSGACLADLGHEVVCVDRDAAKIAGLRAGRLPIYEPGLEALIAGNVAAGRLSFVTDLALGMAGAEVVLIAVGTPSRAEDGRADLGFVLGVAAEIGHALSGPAVIVTKSTVPVGTNRAVAKAVLVANPQADFDIASNPEFLREGVAIADFMQPDRIVVGVETERARARMAALYAPLVAKGSPLIETGIESAELIKYASNAFLATKVTFINEIASLCEKVGADVMDVSLGMGLDQRIGPRFLQPGPGIGGSCFPKDAKALAHIGRDIGVPLQIVDAVVGANDGVKQRMIEKLVALCDGRLAGKMIAVFGVTFKPDTDDMREAPSLTIVPALVAGGAKVRVTDPQGRHEGEALLPGVTWVDDPYEAATGADLVVILTEWALFKDMDLARLAGRMAQARIADLRNIHTPEAWRAAGFTAISGLGRTWPTGPG